jgi:hypothetical protein
MKSVRVVVAVATACLMITASASASWGRKAIGGGACSAGEGHHCYAVAEWFMPHGNEKIEGLSTNVITTAMNVPYWQNGDFVDNEQWANFPNGRWVEDGQTAGNGYDAISLHWFYAYKNCAAANCYWENLAPWADRQGWVPNSYTVSSIGGGTWCFKIGSVQTECDGGFDTYTKDVEAGAEFADEAEPANSGKQETGVQWIEGAWHHWAAAAWFHEAAGTCVSGWQNIAGYINYGTC